MATVRKRGSGFEVRWSENGLGRSRGGFHTKTDAKTYGVEQERRKRLGGLYVERPDLFGSFLDAWMGRQRWRDSTRQRNEEASRRLNPLRSYTIDRITLAVAEDLIYDEIAKTAPRQAQIAGRILKACLKSARMRGQVVDPHVLELPLPGYEEREPVFLTWGQVLEVSEGMPEFVRRIVPVAALTGMRCGELFALRDSDVDFESATVSVVASVRNGTRGRTKTRSSRRTVDLPPLAVQLIREQMLARPTSVRGERGPSLVASTSSAAPRPDRESGGPDGSDLSGTSGRSLTTPDSHLLFPSPMGGPLNANNFRNRWFKPAAKLAGHSNLRPHDLRHSCASLMIAAGCSIPSIAAQLGHNDGGVLVLRRYGHLLKNAQREAALRLDTYVNGLKEATG